MPVPVPAHHGRLLKDWRLDRYYAPRIRPFDVVLSQTQPDAAGSATH